MNRRQKAEDDLRELLKLAEEKTPKQMKLVRVAVRDALKLSQALRLRIPLEQKRKLCKRCFSYLKPGSTSTVRIAKGRIIVTCKHCGHVKRLQYSARKKNLKQSRNLDSTVA